jgi:hypothetical protein
VTNAEWIFRSEKELNSAMKPLLNLYLPSI